jgi:hypothetical protein
LVSGGEKNQWACFTKRKNQPATSFTNKKNSKQQVPRTKNNTQALSSINKISFTKRKVNVQVSGREYTFSALLLHFKTKSIFFRNVIKVSPSTMERFDFNVEFIGYTERK